MERERWGQVEQIFHSALQVEESRRTELVRQSCAGDEDLRREVESLLAHHSESASFIETPAFAGPDVSALRPRSSRSLNPNSGLAETVIGPEIVLVLLLPSKWNNAVSENCDCTFTPPEAVTLKGRPARPSPTAMIRTPNPTVSLNSLASLTFATPRVSSSR